MSLSLEKTQISRDFAW